MKKDRILKVWNTINGVLLGLVVLLAIALAGVRLFGVEVYVVLSGSMEPAYKTGAVIYVTDQDAENLEVGEVITFRLNGDTIATHRIAEVTEKDGALAFRTKGDANEIEDATLVTENQVIGTPIFTIPYLGYLVTYVQSTSGRYATIATGATLLLMMFLPDIIFGDDKTVDEKKSKEKSE